MENIQSITNQTPIEIALGIDENGMTTARALYDFLEMPQKNFARWAKQNIESNEYYDENKDWWRFVIVKNGNECKDYRLTTDFAKHLSMESHCTRGKIARQYFVSVENKAKDMVLLLKEASNNPMKLLELHYEALKKVDQKVEKVTSEVNNVKTEIETLRDELPLFPSEADKIKNAVNKKVVSLLGGKQSNAYKNKSLRQKLFTNCYFNLKSNFDIVGKYTEIKRKYRREAIKIVEEYQPPFFLKEQIDSENAQMELNLKGGAAI